MGSARLSTSNPPPTCTEDTDAGTLTCVKEFAEKLYATEDADLGDYPLINSIGASFKVTAMVNSRTGHSETPTDGDIENLTLEVTLKPTDAKATLTGVVLVGVTGTVYAPLTPGKSPPSSQEATATAE